jgi:hypothetical protein
VRRALEARLARLEAVAASGAAGAVLVLPAGMAVDGEAAERLVEEHRRRAGRVGSLNVLPHNSRDDRGEAER